MLNLSRGAFARGHYQLPQRYMLFVGSIEERKNLALAVTALAQLKDKDICFGGCRSVRLL